MPPVLVKPIEKVLKRERRGILARPVGAVPGGEGEARRPATPVVVEGARSGEWRVGGRAMMMETNRAGEEVGR